MKNIKRCILIMCDSLRRDLILPDSSPTLTALTKSAVWFANANAVFPSTTRVSSASIATGCHPGRHGLLGNKMIIDEARGLRCHNVGEPIFRDHLEHVTGRTLRVPTLAQRVAAHGGACIMSNVSPGAAYFNDPDGYGEVFHSAGSYGPGREPYLDERVLLIKPGSSGDQEMTTRFCQKLLRPQAPVIATLWLSEPDYSGHGHPLGSPAHFAAIGHANACVAQVLEAVEQLRARGDDVLLMVASDHGMETVINEIDVGQALVEAGLKSSLDSDDVVIAPNGSSCMVAIAPRFQFLQSAIVDFLSRQPWCSTVYEGQALAELGLSPDDPGTTLAVIMQHYRQANEFGIPGSTCIVADAQDPKAYGGFGQHGGLGTYEQAPFLIVQGKDFAAGSTFHAPVSLVDFAPTLLHHLGLPCNDMDGSPLQLRIPAGAQTSPRSCISCIDVP
ncbi:alkaline phosphatase family protein [Pseudomonas gingeri]|uniref:Alkaline phosphatase family protein n=1 Tax=Pseudomonas gingeri TaxID=117681 RepID=A0A7Y7YFG2_9PSED|nr:alkaline phosphatase family protein [Pseudomonas gingeri]NWB27990.1 alkaline phosphatase family protein [Pseudomonas gingeri]NWC35514.1 alkaline phosphatase family protein [Pseudomonas gingeri]